MALPEITSAQFTGILKVSADTFVQQDFQAMIDEVYPELVREILSDAAYIEIRDAVSLPEKWSDVMNGCTWTDSNGKLKINSGLTAICRYWLYWYWVKQQPFVNTNTGIVKNLNENSIMATLGNNAAIAAERYNKGVNWLHDELYPFLNQFESVSRDVISFVDLGGGMVRYTVSDTKYLADGDMVNIDFEEFESSNVTATTFDVDYLPVLPESVTWFPFDGLNKPQKERVFA